MLAEEKICSNTIFIYTEINGRKGFWKWSKHMDNIKKYILDKLGNEFKNIGVAEIMTISELQKFIKQINGGDVYKFYIYDDVDKALERVKKNDSYIYIDKNRTFREDNYCCE